jgi:hypothetical protein
MTIEILIADKDPLIKGISSQLRELAEAAVNWTQRRIPLSDVSVVIYRDPMGVIPETGVGGFSPSAHVATIAVDPANPFFGGRMVMEVPATIIHELHHCSRWAGPGYGRTLLEALVSEGLAQHFEADFRGGVAPFYASSLSPADLESLSLRAIQEFDSQDYSHSDWFFGSVSKNIPKRSGYSIGFNLVGKFLRAHQSDAASYHQESAESFRSFSRKS